MEMTNRKTVPADFDTAITEAGFGRFQTYLLAVCGIIYSTCAISVSTLSFVLPSAECDFHLTSSDKGHLTSMPLLGMVVGSFIWGSLADSKGRKRILLGCLLVDAAACLFSSVAQNFSVFLICRFFNGFGIIGPTCIIFSYFGEFLSKQDRDVMLAKLEIFWNLGIIFLPVLAWIVIPASWGSHKAVSNEKFFFGSWRLFCALCALPSFLSAVLLSFLPESPRFLIDKRRHEEAKRVMQTIYSVNTGKNMEDYPVLALQGEKELGINYGTMSKEPFLVYTKLSNQIKEVVLQSFKIFTRPYLKFLVLVCFVDFCLMCSYYTLLLWFPDLFDRFTQFETNSDGQSAGVCDVSGAKMISPDFDESDTCNEQIKDQVFLDTLLIGMSCLPASISLGYLVHRFGKKAVLVSFLCVSGLATLGLNWVHSAEQTLLLSCVFEALTSTVESVVFCVVVELFPTKLRAIALSITVSCGRLGAIFGNIIFGALIDINCYIPIYTFGSLLISSGIVSLALPRFKYSEIQAALS